MASVPRRGSVQPYGIATDGTKLFVADTENHTIRQIIISTGTVSTLAGLAGTAGFLDGNNATATFHEPMGIATQGEAAVRLGA